VGLLGRTRIGQALRRGAPGRMVPRYPLPVDPNDHVCLCFHVSLGKIRNYLKREDPPVASLISECLSAGTGCQWCVPFLKYLHTCHLQGREPDLRISPEEYARSRMSFRATSVRDPEVVSRVMNEPAKDDSPNEKGPDVSAGPA